MVNVIGRHVLRFTILTIKRVIYSVNIKLVHCFREVGRKSLCFYNVVKFSANVSVGNGKLNKSRCMDSMLSVALTLVL